MDHPFQVLGAIECLLLLQQECIGDQRQSSNSFAVCWIGKWNAFVVREVRSVILSFSTRIVSTDLGCDRGRSFVGVLEM